VSKVKGFLADLICDEKGRPSLSDLMALVLFAMFVIVTAHSYAFGVKWGHYDSFAMYTVGPSGLIKLGSKFINNLPRRGGRLMGIVPLLALLELAADVRPGTIKKLYLHWTGGAYMPNDLDRQGYHVLIDGAGRVLPQTGDLTEYRAHTFGRNAGGVGIALCCCLGAVPGRDGLPARADNVRPYCPPTDAQIEAMARAVATLAPALGLGISIDTVLTHAEAADNLDGWMVDYSRLPGGYNGQPLGMYGPLHTCEKWDLWRLKDFDGAIKSGGDVLRGKARWYLERGGIGH